MKLNEIITPKRAAEIIERARPYKQNIKKVIDNQLLLFRTSRIHSYPKLEPIGDFDYFWKEIPKRQAERTSIVGTQFYMWWVDAKFEDFPKRSKSYFATQHKTHGSKFGYGNDTMMIIPADNVEKFGWMPTDFNEGDAPSMAHMYFRSIQTLWTIVGRIMDKKQTSLVRRMDSEIFHKRKISCDPEDGIPQRKFFDILDALNELIDNEPLYRKWTEGSVTTSNPMNPVDARLLDELKSFKDELREEGFESIEDMLKRITPTFLKAELFTDLAQIKKSSSSKADELWFEGDYLAIRWYGEEDSWPALKNLYDQL